MKQLVTLFFVFLIGSQLAVAQTPDRLEQFKAKAMPQFAVYFSKAEINDFGQLRLLAMDSYTRLKADERKSIISNMANAWRDSVIVVKNGTENELWSWSPAPASARLIDTWDNEALVSALPVVQAQSTAMHPWFIYFGYQLMGDSQKNLNLGLNTRFGFYLLLNRWDLATTFSFGMSGNIDAEPTGYSNLGLMSRVYFPIKNTGFSPNIGAEVAWSAYGEGTATVTPSLVLGLSWFVGIGRIDIGLKIGDVTSGMGGYTIYPGMGKHR